ncbi:hypothetical protein BDW74DRAFT_180091 [Aspergillus multicolor]|uniref:uncharacterized protein n=1 Tax=Aspergillus multicolor TaxID=41759 RepID=UPI003CCDE14A
MTTPSRPHHRKNKPTGNLNTQDNSVLPRENLVQPSAGFQGQKRTRADAELSDGDGDETPAPNSREPSLSLEEQVRQEATEDQDRARYSGLDPNDLDLPLADEGMIRSNKALAKLANQPVLRKLDWRKDKHGKPMHRHLRGSRYIRIGYKQTRNPKAKVPCLDCRSKCGPWKTCVISKEDKKREQWTCTNCDFRRGNKHPCGEGDPYSDSNPRRARRNPAGRHRMSQEPALAAAPSGPRPKQSLSPTSLEQPRMARPPASHGKQGQQPAKEIMKENVRPTEVSHEAIATTRSYPREAHRASSLADDNVAGSRKSDGSHKSPLSADHE